MPDRSDFRPNLWPGSDGSPVYTTHIDRDRRDIDVSSEIYDLVPDASPYLVVLARVARNPVGSAEWIWYDDKPADYWLKTTHEETDDATTIRVEDSSPVNEHDILKVAPDGEVVRVTDVPDSTSIEVVREVGKEEIASTHVGGTEKAVIPAGTNLLRMGNAMEERSKAPDSRATQPTKLWNYVQTFRTPIEGSNDVVDEGQRAGPDERTRKRQKKAIEHRRDVERALLFGERNEDVNNKRRFTGGLLQFIDSNVYDMADENNGVLTEVEWTNFLEQGMWYGSDRKLFIGSPRVLSIIDQFAAGRIITESRDETYGLSLRTYISTHGVVDLALSKVFEKEYGDMGILLDVENVSYRPFAGKDHTLRTNLQDPDLDGWLDEYMTKVGLEVRLEKTHAVLTGVEK